MDRAYLERTSDSIGQEWIISHKKVRNGISFGSGNANTIFIFEKWKWEIKRYRTASGISFLEKPFPEKSCNDTLSYNDSACLDIPIIFDKNIYILGFSGELINQISTDFLGYTIFAPNASWWFFTGNTIFSQEAWVSLSIWYTWSNLDSPRTRRILLTPYLQ